MTIVTYHTFITYLKANIPLHTLVSTNITNYTNEVKGIIDKVTKLMNDAAEYQNSRSNITLQWTMMIITALSLLVALALLNGTAVNEIVVFIKNVMESAFFI